MNYIKKYRHGVPFWEADPQTKKEFIEWLNMEVDIYPFDPNVSELIDDSILNEFLK